MNPAAAAPYTPRFVSVPMAAMPQSARLLLALLLVPALGGCVREVDTPPPAAFPALDAARMAGRPDCPELAGRYSAVAEAGSDPALAQALIAEPGADALQVARAGTSLQFASWWSPAAVASAARDLAGSDRDAYARWWTTARELLSRPLQPHANAAASALPGPAPVRIGTVIPTCTDGWMAYGTLVDMGPPGGRRRASTLRLARDVGGGLVLRNDIEVDRIEIPLWCGDGCRGPTLYAKRETRWARFPAAPATGAWTLDFAALPAPADPAAGRSPP